MSSVAFNDNIMITDVLFYNLYYVSFKPLYFALEVLFSCDMITDQNWLDIDLSYGWNIDNYYSNDKNLFISDVSSDGLLSLQNITIFMENNSGVIHQSLGSKIESEQIYGEIRSIISDGFHQYLPYLMTDELELSALQSFDQQSNDSLVYEWQCSIISVDDHVFSDRECPFFSRVNKSNYSLRISIDELLSSNTYRYKFKYFCMLYNSVQITFFSELF